MIEIINHYQHPAGKNAGELVMRGTPLGNPFNLKDYGGDRDKVCDLYDQWLKDHIQKNNPAVIEELNRLYCKWKSEGVLRLVCCCAPKRCHSESIRREIMQMENITSFRGEYAFLSNFYDCKLEMGGELYPSAEHAYQAAKTLNSEERRKVREALTPGIAKKLGRKVTLRENWDQIKESSMRSILKEKFSDPALKEMLKNTGFRNIIEDNQWHDNFFGVCSCGNCPAGNNVLGKLLMELRRPRVYAGIGAVESPLEICDLMEKIGKRLAELGWELSSGKAKGADSAFERGCDSVKGLKRIFRPHDAQPKAFEIAEQLHPAWSRMNEYGQGLQARNVHQVLGPDLRKVVPVRFIVCWTPRGAAINEEGISLLDPVTTIEDGGTGMAIRVANQWNQIRIRNDQKSWIIPIFNLRNDHGFDDLLEFLKKIN